MTDLAGAAGDFRDLARNLRLVGAEELHRELYKAINDAAQPLGRQIRNVEHLKPYMPDRYAAVLAEGLAVRIAKRTAGTDVGVFLKAKGRRHNRHVERIDQGLLRHPVFGTETQLEAAFVRGERGGHGRGWTWVSQDILAGFSICALDAKPGDGHVKPGVAAGDHAAILWPLLCGIAKARYYLLTGEMITGEEAERLGMVSKAAPRDQVLDEALRVANSLATGSQLAIRWTKWSLNNWLKMVGPIFDQSAGYEMLCFMGPDVLEGAAALTEKREPRFPSAHQPTTPSKEHPSPEPAACTAACAQMSWICTTVGLPERDCKPPIRRIFARTVTVDWLRSATT